MKRDKLLKGKKYHLTIKTKLIISFSIIVILMSIVSLFSYSVLRSYINQQNIMIEKNVLSNKMITLTNEIPHAISRYLLNQEPENKEAVDEKFIRINHILEQIEANVFGDDERKAFYVASRMLESYSEASDKLFASTTLSEMVEQNNLMKRYSRLISAGIQEYMSLELTQQDLQRTELTQKANTTGIFSLVSTLSISVFSILFATFFSLRLGRALNKMVQSAQNIANGNLQGEEIKSTSNDELMLLAEAFNEMKRNLGSMIQKIVKTSNNLYDSSSMIKDGVEQSNQAVSQIAVITEDAVAGAQNQVSEAEKTDDTVRQLIQMNKKITDKSENVLTATNKSIQVAEQGNVKVQSMLIQMDTIQEHVMKTQGVAGVLKENSSQIKSILQTISNITANTELLALNASIEAARVGEYGKGFTVVANEVRKLATSSATSTVEISHILTVIQNHVDSLLQGMSTAVEQVTDGSKKVFEVEQSFKEIVASNNRVDDEIKNISEEISIMVNEINRIAEISKNICKVSVEALNGNTEISSVVEEQLAIQEEFLASATNLADISKELTNIVSKFKV
ncbi:methyl-accepting chemotaxis protein [Anaerobacillus alkalilacustris]|uniref:Methyl-accepting chemotaxis protein n=1 Tax=Anaerobacillus alkalilacustris TaxID=393763 RepID=A0A1S2LK32_9BACI|nr:methyl-accepting chemotaxis protein [Anaerobacillus alkalilacustris]OIJ11835.1 methyl-accepting chemotaxis protein [Anaerobacillus alkalilacustris]